MGLDGSGSGDVNGEENVGSGKEFWNAGGRGGSCREYGRGEGVVLRREYGCESEGKNTRKQGNCQMNKDAYIKLKTMREFGSYLGTKGEVLSSERRMVTIGSVRSAGLSVGEVRLGEVHGAGAAKGDEAGKGGGGVEGVERLRRGGKAADDHRIHEGDA